MGAAPEEIEFDGRRRTRPRLLVGVGLGLLSTLSWLGERTAVTWAVSLLLGSCAAYLVLTGRSRRGRIRVVPGEPTILSTLQRRPIQGVETVELVAAGGERGRHPRASYTAETVDAEGRRHELYESADPAELLSWARRLDGALPVRITWEPGRPRVRDWLDERGAPAHGAVSATTPRLRRVPPRGGARIVSSPYAQHHRVSRLLAGIAVGVSVIWTIFLLRSEATVAPLSVALALASVAFVVLTAALVATDRTVVDVGETLTIERRRLGARLWRREVPLGDVVRAAPVTPDGDAGFLVVVTEQEILSVPLAQPAAARAARTLGADEPPRANLNV